MKTGKPDNYKEIIQWACKCLPSLGYTLKSNVPKNVQNTPWSYVVRFETSDGYIYLKHTPEQLALEPTIFEILHDQFQGKVPEVIAHNVGLNCFLMKDAGRILREILKQQFDVELYCKAIDKFTSMQLSTADHINIFLDIGVPDWRLDNLPYLYMQLLLQKDGLIADGLSENEIQELETLLPIIRILCHKLSDYGIKQSIVQPDFHDNNILIDEKSQCITIIDLGEIVVSHPFFALTNCLWQAKRHHALTNGDDAYQKLMDACLNNFTIFAAKNDLLDAFAIASRLNYIYQALAYNRLIFACDNTNLHSFYGRGRLSWPLKQFLNASIKESKQ